MTSVPVIAAVISRAGRFLLGRRPPDKRHGGLWEFPGGKVRPGETWEGAARRELDEELSLEVTRVGEEALYSQGDDRSPYLIHFVAVEAEGTPTALEHTDLGWFTAEELATMPLAPADAGFVRALLAPR